MLGIPLNKGNIDEIHVAHRLTRFTLLAEQTCSRSSKLPTETHQLHYPASRTSFSDTITSCRKTAEQRCIETEQRYLHFSRQNLMLISPPNDKATAYRTN